MCSAIFVIFIVLNLNVTQLSCLYVYLFSLLIVLLVFSFYIQYLSDCTAFIYTLAIVDALTLTIRCLVIANISICMFM